MMESDHDDSMGLSQERNQSDETQDNLMHADEVPESNSDVNVSESGKLQ